VLDLGCGTGYFQPQLAARYPEADYIGLDLAQGMLSWARTQHPEGTAWVAGDAEALPLAAGSIHLVFSSLAFQWCYRPDLLFAELARVLDAGGRCFFSSLGPATLHELRDAWAAADGGQHVNDFLPPAVLQAAADAIPGVRLTLHSERIVLRYDKATDLLHELKTLGAHNMNSKRPSGLTGRQRLAAMVRAYETWRAPSGLPATYDVIYGKLEKP
jgi:malonyl-CoA O-methyltransferase